MITVRRCGFALAITLALTGAATAQVPFGNGGTGGNLVCTANVANPTQARAESHSELLGDIVIACTGGTYLAAGSTVPTANITVTLANTYVTSRILNVATNASEALLLIDEPNAPVGGGAGFPMTPCGNALQGAGPGGCVETAGTATPTSPAGPEVYAGVTSGGAVPNVFQGLVPPGSNQVIFNGVPILAPVTSGFARVFRITNVRADIAAIAGGQFQGTTSILVGVTVSNGVLVQSPVLTGGNVFTGLNASIRNAANSAAGASLSPIACGPIALTPGAVLRFQEGFASAFKTRIAPNAPLSGAATPANSTLVGSVFAQNTPGVVYGGSESGFAFATADGTAGLANFGTRLKATFANVPAGVSIYVSTTNINPQGNAGVDPSVGANLTAPANAVAAGNFASVANATTLLAGLVTSDTATEPAGAALPLQPSTTTSGGVALYGPLPVDGNGTATATWEVFLSNPAAPEVADFAVFYSSTGATSPGAATVVQSFAPAYANGADSTLISRFLPSATASTLLTVPSCQVAAAPTFAFTSSANPSTFSQSVTFSAALSGSGTPTGSVTFKDGSATLSTVALSSGRATLTTSALAVGSHSIQASYSGDGAFLAASANLTQVVNRAATTTTLSAGPAFAATVTSSAGTPSGIVSFRDSGFLVRTIALDNTGIARYTASDLGPGEHSITATYEGNSNLAPSVSGAQRLVVARLTTSVGTPFIKSGTLIFGDTLVFGATADGVPNGASLSFNDGGASIGGASLDGSGTATVSAKLGLGQHLITASFAGDARYDASTSGSLSVVIRATPTVTLTATANPAAGAAVTFTATVAPPAGVTTAPTGSVSFNEGATRLGVANLSSGNAVLTLPAGLPAGDHSIVATYGTDTNFIAASSAAYLLHVGKTSTVTTLAEAGASDGYYLSAAVTPSGTGVVDFVDVTAGSTLGTSALSNGAAGVKLAAPLPIGHLVRASYRGDSSFAASDSPQQVFIAAADAFAFAPRLASGAVVAIFGAGLAAGPETAPGLPLPATLGGVTVRIVDEQGVSRTAALYFVSQGQVNFVLPPDQPAGPARLSITTPTGALVLSVIVSRSAPALASADGSGTGTAAAQFVRLAAGLQQDPTTVSAAPIPFASGDRLFLVLYGTGLRNASGAIECSLNGHTVPSLFAGAQGAYPGLDQINLEVPAGLSGVVKVSCTADGLASNVVTLNLVAQ